MYTVVGDRKVVLKSKFMEICKNLYQTLFTHYLANDYVLLKIALKMVENELPKICNFYMRRDRRRLANHIIVNVDHSG